MFAALDTEAFKLCFIEWVKSFQTVVNSVIAIDGKTLRNSLDNATGLSAIHMVSAFATDARLVLAQQKVDEKSNEIKAIPKLLNLLNLKGQIVTIDAIWTQRLLLRIVMKKPIKVMVELKCANAL